MIRSQQTGFRADLLAAIIKQPFYQGPSGKGPCGPGQSLQGAEPLCPHPMKNWVLPMTADWGGHLVPNPEQGTQLGCATPDPQTLCESHTTELLAH